MLAEADPEALISPISWQRGQLIGAGSFGKVFFGLNTTSGELMAVKQIEYGGQPSASARSTAHALQREVRCLQSLQHANIVRYLGVERDDVSGVLSIFLEYCAGGSIASLLDKFGAFNEHLAASYVRMVLFGLAYLHSKGIMHRDIKGANVLVDSVGVCKLADFGASKVLQQDLLSTTTGTADGINNNSLRGTPYWMAPEVIKQTGHGMPADVWSLGCTLIEMLTAKPPWANFPSQISALFHIASSKDPPPMPPGISADTKDFLLRCLQREPKQRPRCSALLSHPLVTDGGRAQAASSNNNSPFSQVVSHRPGGLDSTVRAVSGTAVFPTIARDAKAALPRPPAHTKGGHAQQPPHLQQQQLVQQHLLQRQQQQQQQFVQQQQLLVQQQRAAKAPARAAPDYVPGYASPKLIASPPHRPRAAPDIVTPPRQRGVSVAAVATGGGNAEDRIAASSSMALEAAEKQILHERLVQQEKDKKKAQWEDELRRELEYQKQQKSRVNN